MPGQPNGRGPALQRVEDALERVGSTTDGTKWRCPGPNHAHGDRDPSLSVTGKPGLALIHCFAGCDPLDVLDKLGLRYEDLFDEPKRAKPWTNGTLRKVGASINEDGRVQLGDVAYLPGADRKTRAAAGVKRAMWPDPESVEGDTIFVVEGESDRVSAVQIGLPAVAIPGASAWSSEWAKRIAEGRKRVVVIADSDAPGRKAAQKWATAIAVHCDDVRIVALHQYHDDGFDLSDLVAGSKTAEDFARDKKIVLDMAEVAKRVKATPMETAEQGVVVIDIPKPGDDHHNIDDDRYTGRRVDVADLLSRPAEPIPWRVHDLVADGTVTIISGEAGSGKSWLAQAVCTAVARGEMAGGLAVVKGAALFIDAEMGARMFVDQRLRPAGVTSAEFELIDAMGLDISVPDDFAWLRGQVEAAGANLVVFDSLRRLVPSKLENDSDHMAPVVSMVAKLARDTNAAIILIHHKGDGEKLYRGSTAIRDQADALFGLIREEDNDDGVRRLTCGKGRGKMRYAPEPADRYLIIDPAAGGVAACDQPEASGSNQPVLDVVKAQVLASLPAATKAAVATKLNRRRDDSTFKRAWDALYRAGTIAVESGEWVVVVTPGPKGLDDHHNRLMLVEGEAGVA